jgi:hypothetical protein
MNLRYTTAGKPTTPRKPQRIGGPQNTGSAEQAWSFVAQKKAASFQKTTHLAATVRCFDSRNPNAPFSDSFFIDSTLYERELSGHQPDRDKRNRNKRIKTFSRHGPFPQTGVKLILHENCIFIHASYVIGFELNEKEKKNGGQEAFVDQQNRFDQKTLATTYDRHAG